MSNFSRQPASVAKIKPGRNDPCPCGSGKKYKYCCGRLENDKVVARAGGATSWGVDIKRKAIECQGAGRFAEAARLCHEVLRVIPNDPEAFRILAVMRDAAKSAVERFRSKTDVSSISTLRHMRGEIISLLRTLPTDALASWWPRFLVDAHTAIKESGLQDLPRDANDESVLNALRSELLSMEGDAHYPSRLLAGMLLCHNFELPIPGDVANIPDWLRERYCAFLLDMPQVFSQVGDAAAYAAYLSKIVDLFHLKGINEHGIVDSTAARALTNLFASRANFVQAYFNTGNLRGIYQKRADLISAALNASGALTLTAFPPRTKSHGKIRLGIFAQHFSAQTETYFTLSHFDFIDRSRFDVTLYAMTATGHALEKHCIERVDRFKVLTGGDLQAQVRQIRADDLDILLIGTNMTAVTNPACLFGSHRLARIQIASVSSPVTTGLRHMDIMLSARWNEPEADAPEHYTEHLWLMPGSINYYAYQYDVEPASVNIGRPDLGISKETIVFFSGANFFKIIPELSLTWAKILAEVPDSVLLLMPFNPNWSNRYQAQPFVTRLTSQMQKLNVDPSRLRIVNPLPTRADVHKVLATADVYLDAYPFAGACSLLDPIIVGVPPIVRSGPVGRSNHGAALMQMVGLNELICDSDDGYISSAIEIASNPVKRQQARTTLKSLQDTQPPLYFDTLGFSTKVGDALSSLHEQYLGRYRVLEEASSATLRQELQGLADSVAGHNFELNTLTDIGIVKVLIEPFFRAHQGGRPHHMVDVGACYGSMAEPLLAGGWTADLFEPDPDARPVLERNVMQYGPRCRVIASAVSNVSDREVTFHKSRSNGLSGLGDSPFGPTEAIIKVPCVRLADFYDEHGVAFVDFLKIDAEGYDFDVLDSHDFNSRQPRLVLVEYGTHFPRQSLDSINQAITHMAAAGYGSISFNYNDDGNFSKGQWNYRLTNIFIDRPVPDLGRVVFGNILFYRTGDTDFLLTLHALLDVCRPRAEAWRAV